MVLQRCLVLPSSESVVYPYMIRRLKGRISHFQLLYISYYKAGYRQGHTITYTWYKVLVDNYFDRYYYNLILGLYRPLNKMLGLLY